LNNVRRRRVGAVDGEVALPVEVVCSARPAASTPAHAAVTATPWRHVLATIACAALGLDPVALADTVRRRCS